jgi:serine/threonine-protein kinase
MSEQRDDLIGKLLGQYEIIEEIGRGGMATVYKARQASISRIVAVKVLPRTFLHDPSFFERFEREVDVIAHLEHPHILPIYDYGKAEDMPYIAMRYLGGGSMAQLIRRGRQPLEKLDRPFMQVSQALDHAHRQGIIHRDLKPGNIMLDEEGNAYLSDFGIARIMGSNLTGSMIIGTPAYMSPEQANGLPLDARSDIYALGIVLFELITGREPFQAETPMALLLKHISEPMPPLASFRPDIPDEVERVIMKATAKDPNQRYSSAGDMAKAFSEALRDPRPSTRTAATPFEDNPTILPDTGRGVARPTPPPVTPYPPQAMPQQTPYPPQQPYPYQQTPPPTPYGYAQTPPPTPYGYPQQTPYPGTQPGVPPYPPQAQQPAPQRSRLPLILGGAAVLIALAVAALVVVPGLTPQEVPVTRVAAEIGTATPFPSAQVVQGRNYSISIPREWIPPQGFFDLSSDQRQVHVWQDVNLEAYVGLTLRPTDVSGVGQYAEAVAAYVETFYDPQTHLTLIEASEAEDGTVRRSYRMVGATTPEFPAGQLDVFFLRRAPYLVVLELYSADAQGSRLVPTFQDILDSVWIDPTYVEPV